VTAAERWLSAVWPRILRRLPDPPARVLEIGCGPLGGFVPMLCSTGYEAIGVDPQAPNQETYRRARFEDIRSLEQVDVVIASTSLHHVADPRDVIEHVASILKPDGTLAIVEWAWECFDEPTAEWCFERLGTDEEPGWLHRRRNEWRASGEPWPDYLTSWAEKERLHRSDTLLQLLDERFRREDLTSGPYFFPDLAETTEADEVAAIEAAEIQPTRIDYVGQRR
jgi:SAM-dependent methyltransferase